MASSGLLFELEMATNEELTSQIQALTQEVARLAADNQNLRESQGAGIGAIPALVEAVSKLSASKESKLVDTKGIGKPNSFDGSETKYRE